MNEFDQFVKHILKIKFYARYTDDFIIVSEDKEYLSKLIEPIKIFLQERLRLHLHPKKVEILKSVRGIDFLGCIMFPHYRLIRGKTRKRIMSRIKDKISMYKQGLVSKESLDATIHSYLGVLSHSDSYNLVTDMKNKFWFWLSE